jgi:hypothetical protein
MNIATIKSKLNNYHKNNKIIQLNKYSNIAGDQFPGEFNVSGFHKQILDLVNKPRSIWGTDKCLRIQEVVGPLHSHVFHMGIFAKSIDLQDRFVDPFKDERFHKLQKEIINQFLGLLNLFHINLKEIEISYLDGLSFGGSLIGRDSLLKRKYAFPADAISRDILKNKVKLFSIKSITNIDINAEEGSLVGPRLEVAYKGIEIATIVFDCFKIEHNRLKSINYVSGYALGIERLAAAINGQNLIEVTPRYNRAIRLITKNIKAANSSLFKKDLMIIIFSVETIALIPNNLSKKQKERVAKLKKNLRESLINLGVDQKKLNSLMFFFKK